MIREAPQITDPIVRDAVEEFLENGDMLGKRPTTTETYGRKLQAVLREYMDERLSAVTYEMLWDRLRDIRQRTSASNANTHIRTCRAFFNWAHRDQDYAVAFSPQKLRLIKTPKRLPAVLRDDDVLRLLRSVPRDGFTAVRDFAMIAVMVATGIRVSEVGGLRTGDVYIAPPGSTIDSNIRVIGKGDKQRQIALGPEARTALKQYLPRRSAAIEKYGIVTDWLFPTVSGGMMSQHAVQDRLRLHGRRIGMHVHPHMLRATFATTMSRNGARLQVIQQAMGHTTLSMTKHYTQVEDTDAFAETQRLNPLSKLDLANGRLTCGHPSEASGADVESRRLGSRRTRMR